MRTESYLPAAVEAEFLVPERLIAPVGASVDKTDSLDSTATALALEAPDVRPLEGLDVLLVEDSLIVALERQLCF